MVQSIFCCANTSSSTGLDKLFEVPCVHLTWSNRTSNSLERSLARSNRASLADFSLSLEVQVYKIILISSSYDQSVHNQSYIISRGKNLKFPVLTLAHAKI